ncbi:ABC transporter substrate-binding protein [Mycetocola zhadangensis]|uniref:Sugar ABC transporter substrate-binding protein n=1 Tax=Mycetocola zhadangensis TaxID=1164595 RepID=A0A3L7J4D8_9MICO|nr:sugar ABC transporter substrate-binding protein [Mycetocola zhadangensis]RLQ84311.1 sugar ABC transporter substrate-binding protein [Mycetocola zhadangensis]GGE94187.1 sugar ABC transporter substrate-binding protein [Mycetocola zhadangensis]
MAQRFLSFAAVIAASALALTGCAAGDAEDEKTTVSFRLWDSTVASAYEESFAAFEKENPDIDVKVNIVGWGDYWTKLRTDVAGKTMDDLFWVNNSYFGAYADSGNLVNIDSALGKDAREGWQDSVVDQFTRDDTLWGVPQLYDAGVAVYYNKDLIEAAGVTPEALADLSWSPDPAADTYLPVAKSLTRDSAGVPATDPAFNGTAAQYGTNIAYDTQAITLPFIGSNGGVYQIGDSFAFSDPKTVEAFQYLVSAINTAKVAPSAADTNTNSDFSRDAFLQGKMAMFQSGLYNLKNVADGAQFDWGVAPMPKGPAGRVTVTNGVVVAGNAASDKQDAIAEVLTWLGSEEGNSYLGKTGAAVPAVESAQADYFDYWEGKGVSVDPFFDVVEGAPPIPAPTGANYGKGFEAFDPIFQEIFKGTLDPKVGLKQAEDAANAAISG